MKVGKSVRGGSALSIAVFVLVFGVGAAGCISDRPEEPEGPLYVGAEEVCDGLFAGPMAKKVESVTDATVFGRSGAHGMQDVVEALKEGYASGHSWAGGDKLCVLDPKGGKQGDVGGLSFSMYAPQDVRDIRPSADIDYYPMGKLSEVGRGNAGLYFECVSPHLKGSEETPLRIAGGFGRGNKRAPDTRELRDANLEIIHRASLAVAKELQCENNGGLPEKPVLRPFKKGMSTPPSPKASA